MREKRERAERREAKRCEALNDANIRRVCKTTNLPLNTLHIVLRWKQFAYDAHTHALTHSWLVVVDDSLNGKHDENYKCSGTCDHRHHHHHHTRVRCHCTWAQTPFHFTLRRKQKWCDRYKWNGALDEWHDVVGRVLVGNFMLIFIASSYYLSNAPAQRSTAILCLPRIEKKEIDIHSTRRHHRNARICWRKPDPLNADGTPLRLSCNTPATTGDERRRKRKRKFLVGTRKCFSEKTCNRFHTFDANNLLHRTTHGVCGLWKLICQMTRWKHDHERCLASRSLYPASQYHSVT